MCICEHIPSLPLATGVFLVVHHREFKKTTNTGVLALRALPNSALGVWGDDEVPFDAAPLADPDRHALVLTPSDDALVLDAALAATLPRPLCLVVPDGSWRQALKMPRRVPALMGLPRVKLPPGPETRYRLREEVRDYGLATFEAIARALGCLEGAAAQATLEALFERYVAATLYTRGRT